MVVVLFVLSENCLPISLLRFGFCVTEVNNLLSREIASELRNLQDRLVRVEGDIAVWQRSPISSDLLKQFSFLYRTKFRSKRRLSVAPLPAIRLNDKEIMVNAEYDAQSVNSAAPSITSINSLASLLKEKMQVSETFRFLRFC